MVVSVDGIIYKILKEADKKNIKQILKDTTKSLLLKGVDKNSFKNKSCENCKYYRHKTGKQRDNMTWETKECEMGMWNDAEFTQTEHISCDEWSKK